MINIIFKNNEMIRILPVEILNTILLLVVNGKILKKLMVCFDNFSAFLVCNWREKGWKTLI
jgi:hypothetical protein